MAKEFISCQIKNAQIFVNQICSEKEREKYKYNRLNRKADNILILKPKSFEELKKENNVTIIGKIRKNQRSYKDYIVYEELVKAKKKKDVIGVANLDIDKGVKKYDIQDSKNKFVYGYAWIGENKFIEVTRINFFMILIPLLLALLLVGVLHFCSPESPIPPFDIAGDKVINIVPEEYNIALHQNGRNDKEAIISQDKTSFTSTDLENNQTANGKVTATNLLAGTWNGTANFELSITNYTPTYSVSEIAQTVMGYNARNTGQNTAILGGDNLNSSNVAFSYDTYVLPLSELGVSVGDTIVFTNSHPLNDMVYNVHFLDTNWKFVKSTNWTWRNINRDVVITEDLKYISFAVATSYENNQPFDKANIPFEDFKLYKNSTSDENEIDYISVWNDMINYDNNLDFNCELWGHNMDWDYQDQQSQYNNQSLEKNLEFFDAYDLDLKTTSDGVLVCWYNATGYDKSEQHTYAELKANNPDLMTYEEMIVYMKNNDKKCFTMPFDNTIMDIARQYGILDNIFKGTNNLSSTSPNGNMYIFAQSSQLYNLDTYLNIKNKSTTLYMNTDDYLSGGSYFTDTQINELLDNDIKVGISFCSEHKITAFVDFCRNHQFETLFKVNHFCFDDENALKCLKAATRYVYGM